MRLLFLILLCLVALSALSPAEGTPFATGPSNQWEPDIYGNYVIYRDFKYYGAQGSAVMVCDLTTGDRSIINPSWNADNRPAVGENRVLWCEWRDGRRAIVSSVIGSGVEDVIVRDRCSPLGLDVNDRWAMWYGFDDDHVAALRVYRFADARSAVLQATQGILDADIHMDHYSDRVMMRSRDGSYSAIDLDTGSVLSCTEEEYKASLHAWYNGRHVWDELAAEPANGYDVHISHAPEPSTLTAFLVGLPVLGFARRTNLRRRR